MQLESGKNYVKRNNEKEAVKCSNQEISRCIKVT